MKGGGFVQEDRRRIQTAVLGSADSDEPLMLPLEAIELDVFRQIHEHDTFWCGLLLGGCGGQLTTKLYTDRVCHFAHYPGPDGLPHECGRRARGVASADHLYVKAAARTWLQDQGAQVRFDFARPDGAPIGSVVDIESPRGALRVHLDQAVPPSWDEGREPVLGVSVPVDRDTLVDRWYVHRIRLESEGTTRRVRLGTEAFARATEWFGLAECGLSERGLTTPAVERIVQARRTPPPTGRPGRVERVPPLQARVELLLRRLAGAQRQRSVAMMERACRDIEAVGDVDESQRALLDRALQDAHRWLEEETRARRALFFGLEEAVRAQDTATVRELLKRATAMEDRTESEDAAIEAARGHCTVVAQRVVKEAAAKRLRKGLGALNHNGGHSLLGPQLSSQVAKLVRALAEAGDLVTAGEREQIAEWKALAAKRVESAERAARKPAAGHERARSQPRPKRGRAQGRHASSNGVQELLDDLERKRNVISGKGLRRRVTRLEECAAPVMSSLTPQQQEAIARWKREAADSVPAPEPGSHQSKASVPASPPRARTTARSDFARARSEPELAAAVRDVLEHAARLGKTVTWPRLCASVKGLAGLSEDSQRAALRQAGNVPGQPGLALSALITTETGDPHPLHRGFAPVGSDQTAWRSSVQQVHRHYRT